MSARGHGSRCSEGVCMCMSGGFNKGSSQCQCKEHPVLSIRKLGLRAQLSGPQTSQALDRPPCLSEGPSELLGALSVGVLGSRGGRRLLCAAVTILVLGGTSASSQAVFKTATRKRLIMKTPNIEELSTFPGCSRPRSPTWRGEGNHSNDAPHTGRLGDPSPKITP